MRLSSSMVVAAMLAASFATPGHAFVFSWYQPFIEIVETTNSGNLHLSTNHVYGVDNGGCFAFPAYLDADFGGVVLTCVSLTRVSFALCATSACGTCLSTSVTTSGFIIVGGVEPSVGVYCSAGPAYIFVVVIGGLAAFAVLLCICNCWCRYLRCCCCYKNLPPEEETATPEAHEHEHVALLAQQRKQTRAAWVPEEAPEAMIAVPPPASPTAVPQQPSRPAERPATPLSRPRSAWAVYKSEHLTDDAIEYLMELGALDEDERIAKCVAQPADVGKRLSRGQVAKLIEFGVLR